MGNVRLRPSYTRHPDAHPTVPPEDLTVVALGSDGHKAWRFGSAKTLAVQHVRRVAGEWGFPFLADVAAQITAELVTRAVKITGNPTPPPRYSQVIADPPPLIGVRLTLIRAGLLLEVWDSAPTTPIPAAGEYFDEWLSVVNEVSEQRFQRWNWYKAPNGGKIIWAELRRVTDHGLPRRTEGGFYYPFPEPDPPITPVTDPTLLQATLDGLTHL